MQSLFPAAVGIGKNTPMLARFIFAPITIAVLALTASNFAEEKTSAVPLKKFRKEAAAKKSGDVPWNKPEPWIGQGPLVAQADGAAGKKSDDVAKPTDAPTAKPASGAPEKPAEKPAPTPATTEPAKPADGEPDVPRAIMVTKRELTAQLQIFLDQQLFSPGMIDGKPGKFVTNALKRWQHAHGLPETGEVDANVPLDSVYPVYTFHTVAKGDFKYVGNLPGKTADQSHQKSLPYPGYTDFLAERYHCSTEFLAKLNPKISFGKLKPGDEVRVPNVAPFKIEEMPDTGNLPEKEEFKNRRIVITRKDTILELFDGEKLIAAIPIAPGSPAHPTPAGKWRILGIASMPTFRWDAGVLNNGVRTNNFYNLPPGPRNPVGVAWMGLNKPGVGIHGTNNPHSIGTFASHGCMRTANWDISRICHMVTAGVTVEIK
jgi:lipoprotein-anchoring transpeptidase ErfK/SrfK